MSQGLCGLVIVSMYFGANDVPVDVVLANNICTMAFVDG